MLVYAAPADYATWTGAAAPANITALLRSASLAVREATEMCFYATDTTGMPTDTGILQAFNDATCCQAAFLNTADVDPNQGAVVTASVEQATRIGSASITFADATAAAAAKQQAVEGLCLDAARILRNAGLTPKPPWQVG